MSVPVNISEIFTSIQGESTWAGRPCFFVRLAGCNLNCSYCDTGYARRARGRCMDVADVVKKFRASGMGLVEVTGGEPLLQPATPELLRRLGRRGQVLLETNGSRDISVVPPATIIIMDIKTPSSGESEAMDWRNIRRLRPHDEVKIIIAHRADYDWACALIKKYRLARRCATILFSPVAGKLAPARLADWLVRDKLPARLNLQLHKIIWPTRQRGI